MVRVISESVVSTIFFMMYCLEKMFHSKQWSDGLMENNNDIRGFLYDTIITFIPE